MRLNRRCTFIMYFDKVLGFNFKSVQLFVSLEQNGLQWYGNVDI